MFIETTTQNNLHGRYRRQVMAIEVKLNEAWASREQGQDVFEVRAKLANLAMVAAETKARVDAITQGVSFATVDPEIKAEGVALIGIVDQLVSTLGSHSDFLNWKQP